MGQIGGSPRVRDDLARALEAGRKVTAKVQWISKPAHNTRSRWIHCTPLLGVNSLIAVWMVILVNDDDDHTSHNQVPLKPKVTNQVGSSIAEVLPWDRREEPTSSDTVEKDYSTKSISPNARQATSPGQTERHPHDPTPAAPDRRRLRKERPDPERLPSDSFNNPRASSAKIAPFASKSDSRYNVSIWSEAKESKTTLTQDSPSRPGKPRFGELPDVVGSNVPPFAARPGPRINGKAYSFNSTSEHGISADEDGSQRDDDERPSSRGSSFTPARRPGPPFHLPGDVGTNGQNRLEEKPPTRKTYKSLSPYGILFDD